MKIKILFTILCTLWCPIALLAQPSQVLPEDSLALIEIYNEFGGAQSGLNWLNGPVESWGDTENEIVIDIFEGDSFWRVTQINIAGKGLSGMLSEAVNALDELQLLSVSNNNIVELPSALSLSNLIILNVGNNELSELPNLDALASLQILNCASNQLSSLPDLNQLTQLETLNFTTNNITQLPDLTELQRLTQLAGQNNRLTFLPELNQLVSLRVLSICCNQLKSLPRLNGLVSLEELSCFSNQLIELPPMDSLFRLRELNCSNNKLDTLPDLKDLEELEFIDCSKNLLKFEDIVPIVDIPYAIVYAPQANMPLFDFYITAGRDIHVDGYEESNPLPSNEYKWVKGGGLVYSNNRLLTIDSTSKSDSTLFTLTVTNPNAPDLEIMAPIQMHVFGGDDEIPFDTTSLIVRRNALSTSFPEQIEAVDIKNCDCISEVLNIELWENIESLIEQNTIRMGSGSDIRKDTFDFNFIIEPGPVDSNLTCGVFTNFSPPVSGPTEYDVNIAVVGSGIASHDDLLPYLYTIRNGESSPIGCISSGRLSWDFLTGNQHVVVNNSHETHIAGIIARDFPGNINLNLIDLKIFDETGHLFDLICAIQFAVEAGAEIINLSLGYNYETPSEPLYRVLKNAEEAGVLVVISAGNEDGDNDAIDRWPGNFVIPQVYNNSDMPKLNNLIVVAGLNDSQDALADFSNHGASTVHIAAPAYGVISTVVTPEGISIYDAYSGTSMAAGEASRVAGILKAYKEDLSPIDNVEAIFQSAISIGHGDKIIMHNAKINLSGAIEKLELPNEEEILMQINTNPHLPFSRERPSPVINGPHESLEEIELQIGNGNLLYRNIDFRVLQIPVPPSGNPVYQQLCSFGNKVSWNGILNDGSTIDLRNGQYLIELRVNGRLVNVFPTHISIR